MAMIDYGAVVIKNGICENENQFFMDMKQSVGWDDSSLKGFERIKGNYFAYVGDEHLTVAVYKYECCILIDKKIELELWGMPSGCKSYRFSVDETNFHLKQVGNNDSVFWLKLTYQGNHYNIIYGYGIDPKFRIWNKTKITYCGKSLAKKIDKLYDRLMNHDKGDAKSSCIKQEDIIERNVSIENCGDVIQENAAEMKP